MDDSSERPAIERRILPYAVIAVVLIGIAIMVFQGVGSSGSPAAEEPSAVVAAENRTSISDFCDFDASAVVPAGAGFVGGCDLWWDSEAEGQWAWAGKVAMIAADPQICSAVDVRVSPNMWGSNTVLISSSAGMERTITVGAEGSSPVEATLPVEIDGQQFRLEFAKTWSPDNGDERLLSQVVAIACRP